MSVFPPPVISPILALMSESASSTVPFLVPVISPTVLSMSAFFWARSRSPI